MLLATLWSIKELFQFLEFIESLADLPVWVRGGLSTSTHYVILQWTGGTCCRSAKDRLYLLWTGFQRKLSVEVTLKDEAYSVGQILRQTFSISNASHRLLLPGCQEGLSASLIFISVFEIFTYGKCVRYHSNLPGTP